MFTVTDQNAFSIAQNNLPGLVGYIILMEKDVDTLPEVRKVAFWN